MGYPKRQKKAKEISTQNTDPQNQNNTETENTNHTEFRKKAEQAMENNPPTENTNTAEPKQTNEVTLENTNININEEPFAKPTVEFAYSDEGINSNKSSGAPKANTTAPKTETTADTNGFEPTPPPSASDEFEPTPPPSDDPQYAETHTVNEGDGTSPFNIPSGSAGELIDWGAQGLNYMIGAFGPLLVGIKMEEIFYKMPKVVERIKAQNDKNTEKIKFDNEDIALIKEPLVAIMQEKGIRGLTNGEKLLFGVAMIGVKKAKVIVEIRKENKAVLADIKDLFSQHFPEKHTTAPAKEQKEDEIPLTEAEEVK